MATAQDLISRAMRLIGVASVGETLSAEEVDAGLTALNAMLSSWRNERLMVYAIQEETLSMVASQSSYTIGPSGDLNTTRPVKIEHAFLRASGVDYPVQIINDREYADIPEKTTDTDIIEKLYYAPSMSTGTLYVWPTPNTANVLHLFTWTPLSEIATSSTTITLPPGYEEMIVFNLAPRLAPEYGVQISQEVAGYAVDSMAAIKRINSQPIKAYTELPMFVGRVHHDIYTDN